MDYDVLMHQMEDRFRDEFAKALQALADAPARKNKGVRKNFNGSR